MYYVIMVTMAIAPKPRVTAPKHPATTPKPPWRIGPQMLQWTLIGTYIDAYKTIIDPNTMIDSY